jgi:hypothetical protein
MIRDRPGRFGGFACLPLPDVDGALAELAYALDDLRLDGVVLFSNARGILLGDPRFTPAVRRAATARGRGVRAPQSLARSRRPRVRTARHAYRLHCRYHQGHRPAALQQHLRPHPDVKYIFARAGSTVPYLAGRFSIIDQLRVIPGAEGRATAAETFRRLYWDTAASWGDACCACCATSRESNPSYSAPTTATCAAIWPSPAATTSRPPRTHRRRADGRPRRHGRDADPGLATLRPRTRTRAL